MDEDKIGTKRLLDTKKLLIFFVAFVVAYWLFNYIDVKILHLVFSDITKRVTIEEYEKVLSHRYHKFMSWQALEPPVVLIVFSLTCVYTLIFKKNYFKESITGFLLFIVCLFIFGFLSKVYTKRQERNNGIRNKSLIVGKWNYTNRVVGKVVVVFNKYSTGYRFADSNKTIQKFRYYITRGSFLAIDFDFELNRNEYYHTDSLTTKTLCVWGTPFFIKNNVYESNFKRGSP